MAWHLNLHINFTIILYGMGTSTGNLYDLLCGYWKSLIAGSRNLAPTIGGIDDPRTNWQRPRLRRSLMMNYKTCQAIHKRDC